MENKQLAQAVRHFMFDGDFKTPESKPFDVSNARFAELKANGLVVAAESASTEEKAAQPVQNKAAKLAANKAA